MTRSLSALRHVARSVRPALPTVDWSIPPTSLARSVRPTSFVILAILLATVGCAQDAPPPVTLRIATINVEDVRTDDLLRTDHPRLKRIAATLQTLRPDIVLMNEIAFDGPGAPYFQEGQRAGQNADRFVEGYLSVSQGDGLEPIRYRTFMAPSNTGLSSGYDLNHNGEAVTTWPMPPSAAPDGKPASQTAEGRAYGDDSWGFGTFPGQYAMALFVREGLEIVTDSVRTFQHFPWAEMPDALAPSDPETGLPWYDSEVWPQFPLSSKSHWDVPVRVPGATTIHVLASHPTPPSFDGPEARNKRRNHDEIRFWNGYLSNASWIRDDAGRTGGLPSTASFVILGDLNADPDEGSAYGNPIANLLFTAPRVNSSYMPVADSALASVYPRLDPDDTAQWGLHVDWVLPSTDLTVLGGRVVRSSDPQMAPSDHFPVYLDLAFPRR